MPTPYATSAELGNTHWGRGAGTGELATDRPSPVTGIEGRGALGRPDADERAVPPN